MHSIYNYWQLSKSVLLHTVDQMYEESGWLQETSLSELYKSLNRYLHYSCHDFDTFSVTLVLIVPKFWIFTYDKCKKLQFIHTVNGDGSKTAKIIKRQC